MHGAALGGGFELALACTATVATNDPKTVLFHGAACNRVKVESNGKVEIELGCKTLVK